MKFLNKYRHLIILIVLGLIVGHRFTSKSFQLDRVLNQMNVESVTLKMGEEEKIIVSKEGISKFSSTFGAIKVRKVGNQTIDGDSLYSIIIGTSDTRYEMIFFDNGKFQLLYDYEGENHKDTYKILKGLKDEELFSLFGIN
ncbi:hypothetical protein [Anaerosphaera multitolerans]|uniref:Uncharacterized protein n=1 Tax=Anaerosphaera multitolerans TaxID=2487351 RepID=A0A437S4R4_9FIRM|nr:hypothetical protein [Anaerosphaera multitolerans]RVU54001.1 hypothetical protein EF514_09805 [Anaerosphaera multitolerans]